MGNFPFSSATLPLTVPNGGTGATALGVNDLLAGGTTATGVIQSVLSSGTAGFVLTDNGSGVLPSFQAAAGGASSSGGITPAGLGFSLLTTVMPPNNVQTLFEQQVVWALGTATTTGTVTTVGLALGRAGVTPDGVGINGMGIWSEAGTLLKATGSMTAAFQTAVVGGYTAIEAALTSGLAITAGTNYYIGALTAFSATNPQVVTSSTGGLALSVINGHYLCLTSAAGQTTMPASFTPSGQTALGGTPVMWAR